MRPSGGRPADKPQLGLTGLGMELLAAVVGCTLVGLWIDRHYESEPWGVLVGGLVGIIGGLTNFIRQANRAVRSPSEPEPAARPERQDEHE